MLFATLTYEETHINAIGADVPRKRELHPAILIHADKVVVDSLTQCVKRAEIQTAVKMGILKENIYAELSDIVLGKKKGGTDAREITVYDATGMAVIHCVWIGEEERSWNNPPHELNY